MTERDGKLLFHYLNECSYDANCPMHMLSVTMLYNERSRGFYVSEIYRFLKSIGWMASQVPSCHWIQKMISSAAFYSMECLHGCYTRPFVEFPSVCGERATAWQTEFGAWMTK